MSKSNNGRFRTLGTIEAKIINQTVNYLFVDEEKRRQYRVTLVKELKKYSLKEKKKGQPENEGCVRELEGFDIDGFSISDPVQYAMAIRERLHTKYLKQNTGREMEALISEIQKLF